MGIRNLFSFAVMSSLAAALALSGCSKPLPVAWSVTGRERIIGGTVVDAADAIGQLTALLYNSNDGNLCTVSILSEEWVLTAAHCVSGAKPTELIVIFARNANDLLRDFKSRKQLPSAARRVTAFEAHPQFEKTIERIMTTDAELRKSRGSGMTADELDKITNWGDIALARIGGGLPAGYHAARFLPSVETLSAGQSAIVAGYGITYGTVKVGSGVLRRASVVIANPSLDGFEVLIDQSGGKGTCHGDSGGPSYVAIGGELFLFGVTSRSYQDLHAVCEGFTVLTNSVMYRSWINQVSGL